MAGLDCIGFYCIVLLLCIELFSGEDCIGRCKFAVSLVGAYVYLSDCNKPCTIYYRPKLFYNMVLGMQEKFSPKIYDHPRYSYKEN